MKRLLGSAVLLLSAACASVPRPGPTPDGIAVSVSARERGAARRQALDAVLPLFLDDASRRARADALETAVYSRADSFVGAEKVRKSGAGVVEIRVDPLSAALNKAGLIRPAGYAAGPDVILIALGDRAAGPGPLDRYAAESLETALFGRGLQAQDADDPLVQLKRPLTGKTEEAVAAEAAAAGWARLVTGRVEGAARSDAASSAWRANAKLSLDFYTAGSSVPARLEASGDGLEISSLTAVSRGIEQAAQAAAERIDGAIARGRGGRATLAVLVSGYKDPALLARVVADLRRVSGVEAAALATWHGLDEMAVIRVYASGLKAEILAARLLHDDSSLRLDGIETEDGRLTVAGPETPESEDRGGE